MRVGLSLGLLVVGLGFGDRWVGFGHGEFASVVVGGCSRFGRAWADSFGVGRVGYGIGCGEFWGVILGFGWDRWGSRVDGVLQRAQPGIEPRPGCP